MLKYKRIKTLFSIYMLWFIGQQSALAADISHIWFVQYQGPSGLETFGNNKTETDYSDIPAHYYRENNDGSLTLGSKGQDHGSRNSKYPRTELREKNEWDIMTGTHKLHAQYTHISGGRQTIMQIHFSKKAKHPHQPPIRLEMIDGKLVAETRRTAGLRASVDKTLGTVAMPTAQNPLDIIMQVTHGTVQILVNGQNMYQERLDWYGEGKSAYFKAGTYNHSGKDTSVTLSSVNVSHF